MLFGHPQVRFDSIKVYVAGHWDHLEHLKTFVVPKSDFQSGYDFLTSPTTQETQTWQHA